MSSDEVIARPASSSDVRRWACSAWRSKSMALSTASAVMRAHASAVAISSAVKTRSRPDCVISSVPRMRPRARRGVASSARWSHSSMTSRSAVPRRGSSSETMATVSPESMARLVAAQWPLGYRRPTHSCTNSPLAQEARHSTCCSSHRAQISPPVASSSSQMRRQAESSTVRGSRLALSSRLSSFSSRSRRARSSSSRLRCWRSWKTRALCTAADAWFARPRATSSSSVVKRRSRSVSQITSRPSVSSPNRRGSERQVFSPQRSMDSRLSASSDGSDRVSITGSRLKRISRSFGRSTSRISSSSTV